MKFRILLVLLLALPTAALAQFRKEQWEGYFFPTVTDSKNYSFEGGTTVRQDMGFGLGFGFAKNLNPHLNLGGELSWGSANYRANVQPGVGNSNTQQTINGYVETYTVRFHGTYNILSGNFTPFVTGGLGWTYIDTNIPTGLPQNVCWFYPWVGQVCTGVTPTYSTTRFSYNAGAGLRYNWGPNYFVRALVNEQFIDFGGSYGTANLTQYRIDFGLRF